uniref:MFS domain-containing protein n=1 Tax=Rhabditophanes sp. KR3021 TaxID=114890 RepID=A0AC35TV64_9BILA
MLFEPSKEYCNAAEALNITRYDDVIEKHPHLNYQFQSLFMHWEIECQDSFVKHVITTAVMIGAVCGNRSVFCGILSDKYGRKPIVISSMILMGCTNLLLTFIGSKNWYVFSIILWVQGIGVGSYMSSHLVLIMEALSNSNSRLLVVCLNAWPFGLVFTAIVAYSTNCWYDFHIAVSIVCLILATVLFFYSVESVEWLIQNNNIVKASKARKYILWVNNMASLNKGSIEETDSIHAFSNIVVTKQDANSDSLDKLVSVSKDDASLESKPFKDKMLLTHLIVLAFSFFSSSIVSYCMYFNLDALNSNIYLNMLIMGILKFFAGFLPFILSKWFSKLSIFLTSLAISAIGSCILIIQYFGFGTMDGIVYIVCSQALAASTDPVFKINHLYSTQIFPTKVRNSCRGICNAASRIGSVLTPGIIYIRGFNAGAPFVLLSILISLQFITGYYYLPKSENETEATERTSKDEEP